MEELTNFIDNIEMVIPNHSAGDAFSAEEAREIVSIINKFLYTNYDGIGTTFTLGEERDFISEYHKFWFMHHADILNPHIDDKACEVVADCLHGVYVDYPNAFGGVYETYDLSPEEVCLLRFYSAPQDFRGSRFFGDFVNCYKKDPRQFDAQQVFDQEDYFLETLGLTKTLSQGDKRALYAKSCAEYLLKNEITPFEIQKKFNSNLLEIRDFLVESVGMGFGRKKTDMFIRDMVVLGIWTECSHFEDIDVASDVNTIKVALRTGMLKTDIPLLTSFMDIFDYQYEMIDDWSARAWRRVWEIWVAKYPDETISSPCLMDYFVYQVVGSKFCKPTLTAYRGQDCGHEFYWPNSYLKKCKICEEDGVRNLAKVQGKLYPCMNKEGSLSIKNIVENKDLSGLGLIGMEECPLKPACKPDTAEFVLLEPPKAISIKGQTGWDTAYAKFDSGGGGLMA